MKKTVNTDIVEMFVNGVLHSLELLESHLKENNPSAAEIELINAKGELLALLCEIDKPET